jgi:hypothetical protein
MWRCRQFTDLRPTKGSLDKKRLAAEGWGAGCAAAGAGALWRAGALRVAEAFAAGAPGWLEFGAAVAVATGLGPWPNLYCPF